MKNNHLLLAGFLSLLALGAIVFGDGLTYLIAALIATITMGVVLLAKSFVMNLTRWSKANPVKTQISIVVMQLLLVILALPIGKNLRELNIFMSDGSIYVFSAILMIGFLMVPFRMKRSGISIPKEVVRQRTAFMGIALSSFMLMVITGNRIEDFYPDTPIASVVQKMDQFIHAKRLETFIQQNQNSLGEYQNRSITPVAKLSIVPNKGLQSPETFNMPDVKDPNQVLNNPIFSKKDFRAAKKQFMKEMRKAETQNMCGLAVVLIILLVITSCAGICLLIGGIASGEVLAAIIGPIVLAGSIWGIVKVSKWCRRERQAPQS